MTAVTWDLGEVALREVLISDEAGAPVNADTLPTYTVTLPDLTAGISPTVQTSGVGAYYVNYPTVQAGLHRDVWTATVAGIVVKFGPDAFRVRTAAPILSLAEARQLLGLGVDPARDERLRDYLDASAGHVERASGRTYRLQVVVETATYPGSGIALLRTPVQSVTSVVDNGTTVDASAYVVDLAAGVLWRKAGCWTGPQVVVTYVAGASVVPDDVLGVTRQVLQHLWSTRTGATGTPRRTTGQDGPDRTLDVILAQLRDHAPGFA